MAFGFEFSSEFPRLEGCGPIEASRAGVCRVLPDGFPRLEGCGPIEARTPRADSTPRFATYFRDWKVAAPLKQDAENALAPPWKHFRDWKVAAPLKQR